MANKSSMQALRGNMVPSEQRMIFNGSPKMAPQSQTPKESKIKNVVKSTRTGDAVSDESDSGDEGESSPIEDDDNDDSEDEVDVHALSGAGRNGSAAPRLAGRAPECDAVGGAEDDEIDDDDYHGVEDISDSDDDGIEEPENAVLKAAEQDLIAEFEETERPRTASAMSHEMTSLTLAEDAALARRLSLQSDDSSLEQLDFNQDPFGGLGHTDSLYQDLMDDAEEDFDGDLASWRIPAIPDYPASRQNSVQSNGNEKRVRFAETATSSRSSSMSSEEEDPRDTFPDLFDGGDDHMTRSQFLMDIDSAIEDDNESVYDYEFADQYEKVAFDIDRESDDDADEDEMSSDCMPITVDKFLDPC